MKKLILKLWRALMHETPLPPNDLPEETLRNAW